MKRRAVIVLVAVFGSLGVSSAVWAYFTAFGNGSGSAVVGSASLQRIAISPTSKTVVSGQAVAYSVTAVDNFHGSTDVSASAALSITPTAGSSCTGNSCTATLAGTYTVTASYSGKTTSASQIVTAGSPSQVVIVPSPASASVSPTSNIKLSLQLLDSAGNATTSVGTTTLTLSSASSKGFFTASSGGTGTLGGTGTVAFASGSGTATEWYGDEAASASTKITASNGANGWGSTTVSVAAGGATKLAMINAAITGTVSGNANLGPLTVQLQDQFGNAVNAPTGGESVALSQSLFANDASFSQTQNAPGSTTLSISIPAGSTTADFFFGYSQTFFGTPTITAAHSGITSATQSVGLNAAPTVNTSSLAAATAGQIGYSRTVAGTGGTTPYTWSISSGTLPTGLSINATSGVISGNVGASATTQSFTVQLTDADSVAATKNLSITVNAAPNITTGTLPGATQTGSYSQTVAASNGTTPYSWSLSSGTLPSGLGINATTGLISGTVGAVASTQTFTVQVVDANGVSDTQSLTITVNGSPSVTTTSLATATDGQTGYSQTVVGSGGTTPYTWSISSGTLPSGLSINAGSGVISGTVSASGATSTFTVKLTDADGVVATKSLTITVNAAPSITTTTLAAATDGQTGYSQTVTGTGGTTPNTWNISTGTLPAGLSINASTGVISGNVGASAASATVTVKVTDANGVAATKSLTLTVNAAPNITTGSLAGATQTGTYSQTVAATGGTTPLSWSISNGTLPGGLGINATTGLISGTVGATATTQTFTVQATDANGVSDSQSLTITVNGSPSVTTTSLATATDGQTGYSQTVVGTSGTTPYTWSISSGTLPSGLGISATTGLISGTVSASAATSTFTVKLTDADGVVATKSLTITVNAVPTITTTTLATATDGQTGYAQTLSGTGGTTPLAWSVSTGTLPAGLSISATTGVISGNVGAGAATSTFTVKLTDTNGVAATKSLTIAVNAAPNITTSSLAVATQTGTYSQTVAATGGTTPLSWSISTGTLPSGLGINATTGLISGTVGATASTQTFTVQATDTNGVSDTQSLTITVNAAPSISTTTLGAATDGQTSYTQTVVGTSGTTPYTWSILTGTLPSGLSINASTGVISGTVGATASTSSFTVKVTDADGVAATKALSLTVNPAPSITTTTLAAATDGQTGYSQTVTGTGGTTPNTWSISTGTLPSGLSINATTGVISGTVGATAATSSFTVKLTDTNGVADTQSITLTVNAAPSITTSTLPGATKTGSYSQTVAATGGTTPLTWSISSGTLPSGLGISATTGVISGTVGSTATTSAFTVKALDANGVSGTQSLTITVNGAPSVTTTSLATATDGQTGYSQTLTGTGGTAPYTWSISSGTLPSGLGINATSGVVSGTVGATATTSSFTVKLTDADGVAVTKSLSITVNVAPSISTTSLPNAAAGSAYSQSVSASGGTTPYAWSISSGALPSGLGINASTGLISGTVGATATTQTFTVQVADANGVTDTQSLTISINITYVGAGAVASTTSSGNLTVGYPSGVQSGDFLLMVVTHGDNNLLPSSATPAGWTYGTTTTSASGATGSLQYLYRTDTSGTSVTVAIPSGLTSSDGWTFQIADFRSVGATPFDVVDKLSSGTTATTFTPAGLTTATANDMVVSLVMQNDAGSTAPTLTLGTTQSFTFEFSSLLAVSGNSTANGLANRLIATPGAVVFPTWSTNHTATGAVWLGIGIALKP